MFDQSSTAEACRRISHRPRTHVGASPFIRTNLWLKRQ